MPTGRYVYTLGQTGGDVNGDRIPDIVYLVGEEKGGRITFMKTSG